MEYSFLIIVSLILLSTKALGTLSQKVHMPAVVGALIAGVVLGPSCLSFISEGSTDYSFIMQLSEIGVIILMFTAGLDTDLNELKKNSVASFITALCGVIVPLVGGMATALCFPGLFDSDKRLLEAIFVGVVLTATSVSITVETLREMGKLKGKVGTTILGAAIIDDILGIIVLAITSSISDSSVKISGVILKILLYFVVIGIFAVIAKSLKKTIDKYDHMRRSSIYALVFCFFLSYISERFFGIADITGAYFAGLILCTSEIKDYILKRIGTVGYIFFAPIFFASVGVKTDLGGFTVPLAIFSAVLLIVAIASKVIGCGIGAKICKFSFYQSICIGIGMISRGEVALIVAQKGAGYGLISESLFPPIVLVVIVTTLITPIFLKFAISGDKKGEI